MRILLICFLFISQISLGQGDLGTIQGKVLVDKDTPADFASVQLKQGNKEMRYCHVFVDENGNFEMKAIEAGVYSVVATWESDFYYECVVENIVVEPNDTSFITLTLEKTNKITAEMLRCIHIRVPESIIRNGIICGYPDFSKMPMKNVEILYPPLIDVDGRFNSQIVREDIIQRR